jgi:hypothetical protein
MGEVSRVATALQIAADTGMQFHDAEPSAHPQRTAGGSSSQGSVDMISN